MTDLAPARPTEGDVLDLILDDHRQFEALLRELRDSSSDRDAVRRALSALHVAHAEAEESAVYPTLRRKHAIGEHEAEHGEHEHAEGNAALLVVLESASLEGEEFDDLVEELAGTINHHLTEEELTILNPARDDVAEDVRRELGAAFAEERNRQLDDDCGRIDNVRAIVERATRSGMLDADEDED
jgi:hemerythrin superfamily protein